MPSFDASYLPTRIDQVVVERLIAGRMRLTDARHEDRDAAILQLTARGNKPPTVASILRCNIDTVTYVVAKDAERRARRAEWVTA